MAIACTLQSASFNNLTQSLLPIAALKTSSSHNWSFGALIKTIQNIWKWIVLKLEVCFGKATKESSSAQKGSALEKQPDKSKLGLISEMCRKVHVAQTNWSLLVNATTQRLHLYEGQKWRGTYLISTSKMGTGQVEGSKQTPLGLHRIAEKIGDGASPFAIFDSRVDTGRVASLDPKSEASIVGRILWLEGLEAGYNEGLNAVGKTVDSKKRYIYIHGTNHIHDLGKPASIGCIRTSPNNIVEVFNKVPEKSLVLIYTQTA